MGPSTSHPHPEPPMQQADAAPTHRCVCTAWMPARPVLLGAGSPSPRPGTATQPSAGSRGCREVTGDGGGTAPGSRVPWMLLARALQCWREVRGAHSSACGHSLRPPGVSTVPRGPRGPRGLRGPPAAGRGEAGGAARPPPVPGGPAQADRPCSGPCRRIHRDPQTLKTSQEASGLDLGVGVGDRGPNYRGCETLHPQGDLHARLKSQRFCPNLRWEH